MSHGPGFVFFRMIRSQRPWYSITLVGSTNSVIHLVLKSDGEHHEHHAGGAID